MDIHKVLPFAAHVAIVLGIAYTVAQATWFFVSGPAQAPLGVRTAVPQQGASQEPLAIEQMIAQHIFGQAAARAPLTDVAKTEALEETRLSLELVGVFVADDAGSSSALIARKGGAAEVFAIGDRLPGNAKLSAVYRDRVVITRGGAQELIVFAKPKGWIASSPNPAATAQETIAVIEAPAPPSAAPDGSAEPDGPRTARQALLENRPRIEQDPRQVLEELGVVAEDGAPGYTLGAVAERPELSHTGLQQGDRILSVNGRPVGGGQADALGDGMAIENLLALGSASLEIQRGQRRFFVTVALD